MISFSRPSAWLDGWLCKHYSASSLQTLSNIVWSIYKRWQWIQLHNILKVHWQQLNGLFPEWVLSCFFKAPAVEHWKSHWQQLNDLSPMRVLSCFIKALAVEHLVTLGATEWFIPSLGSFVSLQSTCCWTFLVTLGATEWFIPDRLFHVSSEHLLLNI